MLRAPTGPPQHVAAGPYAASIAPAHGLSYLPAGADALVGASAARVLAGLPGGVLRHKPRPLQGIEQHALRMRLCPQPCSGRVLAETLLSCPHLHGLHGAGPLRGKAVVVPAGIEHLEGHIAQAVAPKVQLPGLCTGHSRLSVQPRQRVHPGQGVRRPGLVHLPCAFCVSWGAGSRGRPPAAPPAARPAAPAGAASMPGPPRWCRLAVGRGTAARRQSSGGPGFPPPFWLTARRLAHSQSALPADQIPARSTGAGHASRCRLPGAAWRSPAGGGSAGVGSDLRSPARACTEPTAPGGAQQPRVRQLPRASAPSLPGWRSPARWPARARLEWHAAAGCLQCLREAGRQADLPCKCGLGCTDNAGAPSSTTSCGGLHASCGCIGASCTRSSPSSATTAGLASLACMEPLLPAKGRQPGCNSPETASTCGTAALLA